MNRYLLNSAQGEFLFVLEGEPEAYFAIDKSCSYKIIPHHVKREGNEISFVTSSFMDATLFAELTMEETADGMECKGAIADYGDVSGKADFYDGMTPYEEMMESRKKKTVVAIPKRSEEEIQEKVEELLGKMTLKEKIGQMSQSSGEDVSEIGDKIEGKPMVEQIKEGEVGSIIYIGYSPETIYTYQKYAVENTRLGIPLLVCQDVIHGFQTIFPIPIAQSCSFDPELIRKGASIAAKEASSAGIMCAFAPMLDMVRDSRWGRVCEAPGEDPYLGGQIAEAVVKGYQGDSLSEEETVAACLKHFVGYSACEAGRDYNTTEISDYTLHNMYLPAFRKGIVAHAAMVMSAFTFLNGRPVTANREILYDLLRGHLGFGGVVITDYAAVKEVGVHGCGKDNADVVKQVLDASVDMEMATSYYNYCLEELVKQGLVPETAIDDAVRRILTLKYRLGIMDDPYRYIRPEEAEALIYSEEHLKVSEKMAEESIVLLKNNGVLPLQKGKMAALIGPFADSKDMLGAWQFSNYGEKSVTIKEGMEAEGITFQYEQGCFPEEETEHGFERAYALAMQSDVIILSLGETSGTTGEATSKCNPCIPDVQMRLFEKLKETKKPMVVTLTNGRPLLIEAIDAQADAVVETWFLGAQAGHAIAGVLSGRISPSGKLSMSFPRQAGQIPVYYNHYNTGRPNFGTNDRFTSRFLDETNAPLYAFGYGLTYGKTGVANVRLSKNQITRDEKLSVYVTIENTGSNACTEVVQLYIRKKNSMYVRPVKELKKFERADIPAEGTAAVLFEIGREELSFYTPKGECMAEDGVYELMAGCSSREEDLKETSFIYHQI